MFKLTDPGACILSFPSLFIPARPSHPASPCHKLINSVNPVNTEQWFVEVCNRSSCASIRQPAEFLAGHALQIACRERGVAGVCASKGLRPTKYTYIRRPKGSLCAGRCPIYSPEVWRTDEAILFTENFQRREKTAKRCPNFQGALI